MKVYNKILVIIGVMVLALGLAQSASAAKKPKTLRVNGLWVTIIQDLPSTVQVGKVYTVKLKYTNRYISHVTHKPKRVKFTSWLEWGSYSYASKADRNPVHYWNVTKPRAKTRWLKPRQSRTMRFRVSFKACLPPWGADWGGQPGDYFYSGLPCSSGVYYLKSTGITKGSRWVDGFTLPYQKKAYIVPAAPTSQPAATPVEPAPTGPTGSSGSTGSTGPTGPTG